MSVKQKERGCIMAPRESKGYGRTQKSKMFKIRVYQKDGRGIGIDIEDFEEALNETNFKEIGDQFDKASKED